MGYYDTIHVECEVPSIEAAVEAWEYMKTADSLREEGFVHDRHWTEFWTQGEPLDAGSPLYVNPDGYLKLDEPTVKNIRIDPHVTKLCEWAQALGVDLWIQGSSNSDSSLDGLWAWEVEDGEVHRYEAQWVKADE